MQCLNYIYVIYNIYFVIDIILYIYLYNLYVARTVLLTATSFIFKNHGSRHLRLKEQCRTMSNFTCRLRL